MLRGHGMKVANTGAHQLGPRSSRMGTLEDPARQAAGPTYRTTTQEPTRGPRGRRCQVSGFWGEGGNSSSFTSSHAVLRDSGPGHRVPGQCNPLVGTDLLFFQAAADDPPQPDFHALQTQLRCSTQRADPSCYLAAASPALSNPTQGSTRQGYVVAPGPASLGVPPPQTREPLAHSRCTSHDCAVCRRPARTENVAS